MELKELRWRCEARLRALELPIPFDARIFCDMVAAKRGRPIVLRPVTSRAGPWGLWVALPTADVIFYDLETSQLHQEHIILHEVGHLLCGHRPVPVADAEFLRLLFPDLRPESVQRVLRRASYSGDEEREAELLASLILERAECVPASRTLENDPRAAELLGRLSISLEDGSGDPA